MPIEKLREDGVTLAALGQAFNGLIGEWTELERAWEAKTKEPGVDLKPIEESLQKVHARMDVMTQEYQEAAKLNEQLRADLDVLKKAERPGSRPFELEDIGVATVRSGQYAGRPVRHVVRVYELVRSMHARASALGGNYVREMGIGVPSKELKETVEELRLYTPDNTALGAEWAASLTREGVWDGLRESTRVATQWAGSFLEMRADDLKVPLGLERSDWTKGTPGVEPASADPATANLTLTVTELVKLFKWSYSFDESTLFDVMDYLDAYLRWTGSLALDKFLMNAHNITAATGNINSDDAAPAADAYYVSNGQNGFIVQGLLDNTAMAKDVNAALTDALLLSVVAPMDEYGHDVENCVHFPEWRTYLNGYRKISEVIKLNEFGPQARIRSGQVGSWSGSAVVPTAAVGRAEADGKQSATASNNTLGRTVIVHVPSWMIAFTRRLMLEGVIDPLKRAKYLIASMAPAIAAHGTRSTNIHTAVGYNITIT